jgi:hypothetical protein
MAKKTFGRGSIADLVREAEETQKKQEEQAAAIASTSELQAQERNPVEGAKSSPMEELAEKPSENAGHVDAERPEQPDGAAGHTSFSASEILSKEHVYKNTTRQVNISEDFYIFLRVISRQCDISVAQMVNNMLRPYLTDKLLKKEIKSLARKSFNEAISKVDEIE